MSFMTRNCSFLYLTCFFMRFILFKIFKWGKYTLRFTTFKVHLCSLYHCTHTTLLISPKEALDAPSASPAPTLLWLYFQRLWVRRLRDCTEMDSQHCVCSYAHPPNTHLCVYVCVTQGLHWNRFTALYSFSSPHPCVCRWEVNIRCHLPRP